jgi:hypothetical protein
MSVMTIVFQCPICLKPFQVASTDLGKMVECPSCFERVSIPDSIAMGESTLNELPELAGREEAIDQFSQTSNPEEIADERSETRKLLPPMFLVDDPDDRRFENNSTGNLIILPDGQGGVRTIDDRIVHIDFGGQSFPLRSLPQASRRRRRFITNMIAVTLCLLFLILAFYYFARMFK